MRHRGFHGGRGWRKVNSARKTIEIFLGGDIEMRKIFKWTLISENYKINEKIVSNKIKELKQAFYKKKPCKNMLSS